MSQKHFRYLCRIIALEFFFFQISSLAWAQKIERYDPRKVSVAVLTYASSNKDRPFLEEAAKAIRDDLRKIPSFHVVSRDLTKTILDYHAPSVGREPTLTRAERDLSLAKAHWFNHQYEEAESLVNQAIELFRKERGKGDLLVDALMTKATILQETKRADQAEGLFQEALKINPSLLKSELPLTGSSRRLFSKTRQKMLERTKGSLEISTVPPGANVYLNGVNHGVTPANLKNLPEGGYLLTMHANHYRSITEPVTVTPNTTQFIKRKLEWVSGEKAMLANTGLGVPVKTSRMIDEEIKRAVKVGETLKVDKVVLVSSERKGKDELLTVRTIDTVLKASYNPIGVSFEAIRKNKTVAIAQITKELGLQARVRVLNNPQKYLEPDTGSVRILRRKRPFTKTPAFYLILGLVVGGAAGTAAGLLLNDDKSAVSEAGGVDIEFH